MFFKTISKYKNTKFFIGFILFLIAVFLVSFNGCMTTEIQQVQSEKLPLLEDCRILKLIMLDQTVINVAECNAVYRPVYKGQNNVIVYFEKDSLYINQNTLSIRYTEKMVNLKDVFSVVVENEELNTGLTILAATGVGLLIAVVVIAATSGGSDGETVYLPPSTGGGGMSCPLVYTFNGSEFKLESETFAGAIIKPAERTTYDNLFHLQPVKGKLILKIADEMPETEYTNELNIAAVDTKENVIIVTDYKGVFHTAGRGNDPLTCTDFNGNDVRKSVLKSDDNYWCSNIKNMDLTKDENLRDGLILEFPKPETVSTAKIVVKGVNTNLTVAAFEELYRMKGENKAEWIKDVESNPAEAQRLANFLKREGMLHVMVWEDNRWVEQGIIRDPGPFVPKEQLAMIDISKAKGNTFRVKLESTTDLWRIDRVYADFSCDAEMEMHDLEMFSATDQNGIDVKELLNKPDDKYLTFVPGNYAIVIYNDIDTESGMYRHYILRSKGYYHPWYETDNKEDTDLYNKVMDEPKFGIKYFLSQWKDRVNNEK